MKKHIFPLILLCSVVLAWSQAVADVALDLLPSTQTVAQGQTFTVELFVSGLTQGGAPSVDQFDIDITYGDPSNAVSFQSVEFGLFLGDPDNPTEATTSVMDVPGQFVWLREDSLLQTSALHALQPASFALATLRFTASNVGSTVIGGDLYVLKDTSGGDLIHAHGPVGSSSVTVIPGTVCTGVAGASVHDANPVYGPSLLSTHLATILFPLAAAVAWRVVRRKK